jgi:hypothetical protein
MQAESAWMTASLRFSQWRLSRHRERSAAIQSDE